MGWHRHDDPDGYESGLSELAELICAHLDEQFSVLHRKVDQIMSEQSNIDADVATLTNITTELVTAAANIQAEIADLTSKGVDTSALQAAVAPLQSAADALAAIPPASPPA